MSTDTYSIPVRLGFATSDETFVANGNIVTLRTITLFTEFDSAVVFAGGVRQGEYKTLAGAMRRVRRELDAPTTPHPRQQHSWAFLTRPIIGMDARVVSWGPRYRTESHGIYLGVAPSQHDASDVHWFRGGEVGSTPQERNGEPGHWTLPAVQLRPTEEAPDA
jgi:hypothetical protein